MKKKTYQINIPEPCNEDWNKMTPQEQGRFCGKCAKVIVDYTLQPDRAIAKALKENNGQICGRFRSDQLQRDLVFEPQFYQNTRWKAFGLMISGLLAAGNMEGQEASIYPETLVIDRDAYKDEMKNGVILSGKVIDVRTQKGIIGASVTVTTESGSPIEVINDSYLETTTDLNGYFELEVFDDEKLLTDNWYLNVDFIGYSSEFIRLDKSLFKSQLNKINVLEKLSKEKGVLLPFIKISTIELLEEGEKALDAIKSVSWETIVMGDISSHENSVIIEKNSPNYIDGIAETPRLLQRVVSKLNFLKKEKQQPKKENTPTETLAYAAIEPTSQKVSKAKKPQNKELPFLPKIIQQFYPNPFSNKITIELQVEKSQTFHLVVFNELGQEIQRKEVETVTGFNQFTIYIDEQKYPSGTYLLSLLDGKEVLQTKVILKK